MFLPTCFGKLLHVLGSFPVCDNFEPSLVSFFTVTMVLSVSFVTSKNCEALGEWDFLFIKALETVAKFNHFDYSRRFPLLRLFKIIKILSIPSSFLHWLTKTDARRFYIRKLWACGV